jgi:two-component system, OmpR family, sensor histidine kinase MprB
MTLRRRLTAAAALAVAAVAVTLGVVGYLTTRSHLVSELQSELHQRASTFLQPHNGRGPDGGGDAGRAGVGNAQPGALPQTGDFRPPAAPGLGAAPGYFQSVLPSGHVLTQTGATVQLPVNVEVLAIARQARGSYYFSATVKGTHVEILAIGDPYDANAVEVALPLSSVDSVLHGLVLSYGLLIGAGILLAIIFGTVIARAALAPIERFSAQTEQVTSALDRPRRLEETGAEELRRLAASFNQTLDALERSIQSQRQLIADASHELRTPMAALRSNIQIFLEAHRLPEDDRRELQGAIVAELDELTQLVTDVLELARGATPNEHTEVIELDVVVHDAVARTQRRGPQLTFELDIEPTVITNAPDRVNRAVTNVIDNARKWSPDGGRVEIALRDGVLTVRDHGPGFPDDDLEHVFDRFYRAHQARRMPGSGLGLAIVKQAAEAHGGFARAANAPGGGALLRVAFGAVPTEQSAPDASAALTR